MLLLLIKFNCILYFFSVDEGSYKPDKKLAKVRELSEEAFKIAHKLKLLKTKEEAVVESDSN